MAHSFRTLACLLTCTVAFVGCEADSAAPSDTEGVHLPSDTGLDDQIDGGVDDTAAQACTLDEDCPGGHVCLDAACREFCFDTGGCQGDLPRCDLETHLCGECTSDAHCAEDEACVDGFCAFWCDTDEQCAGDDERCLEDGTCRQPDCAGDDECGDGQRCAGGFCLDEGLLNCEPGSVTCSSAQRVATCSVRGIEEVGERCPVAQSCVDSDDRAACQDWICQPDERRCLDENTTHVCDGSGMVETLDSCPDDELCHRGRCVPEVCEPADNCEVTDTCDEPICGPLLCAEPATSWCQDNTYFRCRDRGSQPLVEQCAGICGIYTGCTGSETIVVEVLWRTPGDPNEMDTGGGTGSDLDLHYLHPDGVWDTSPLDCHWKNKTPNWGDNQIRDDDPSLVIDDTDGRGPEIVRHAPAEPGVYRVGVFYFSDHDYGPTDPTVRIWIGPDLKAEIGMFGLSNREFWDVAAIDTETGEVEVVNRVYPSGLP